MGIPANDLIVYQPGSNGERATWGHPQAAINIAKWISPEFDVKVSKWIFGEYKREGSSYYREKSSYYRKDQVISEKDQTIMQKEHKISLQESQLYALKRRHKYIDKEFKPKSAFYIISDAEQGKCHDICGRRIRRKAGIVTSNIVRRLGEHRTDVPSMRIDYLAYLKIGRLHYNRKMYSSPISEEFIPVFKS